MTTNIKGKESEIGDQVKLDISSSPGEQWWREMK